MGQQLSSILQNCENGLQMALVKAVLATLLNSPCQRHTVLSVASQQDEKSGPAALESSDKKPETH